VVILELIRATYLDLTEGMHFIRPRSMGLRFLVNGDSG
jgi:hypothetical protein